MSTTRECALVEREVGRGGGARRRGRHAVRAGGRVGRGRHGGLAVGDDHCCRRERRARARGRSGEVDDPAVNRLDRVDGRHRDRKRLGEWAAELGRLRGAAGDGREDEALALERADVDMAGPRLTPLVCGRCARGRARADRGAARQQRHCPCQPAVVAQGAQKWVAADQVVRAFEAAHDVATAGLGGDDRVRQCRRGIVPAEGEAAVVVGADCAVGQRGTGRDEKAAADVAADGAVGQRRRPLEDDEAAAAEPEVPLAVS